MNPPPSKRRHGEVKLTEDKLFDAMDAAILSLGSPELAVLYLFNHYDFYLDDLRCLLLKRQINVSFSNVKYWDIAPRVGLTFGLATNDMPTIDIHRARIPCSMFKEITGDLQVIMRQYRDPVHHNTGSRFLAPLFNRLVALFHLTIFNTPESIIPGHSMTTRGQIEYHFLVFGRLSILVLEAKFSLGADEYLHGIAQVIAECNACDYANDQLGLPPSVIYGILSDGMSFEFFTFDGSAKPPIFSRGVFRKTPSSKPYQRLATADYRATSVGNFIRSLRPICETIFYFLLLAYGAGVTHQSVRNGIKDKCPRKSYPSWVDAKEHADAALALAVDAVEKASAHDDAHSIDQKVQESLGHLQDSLKAVPAFHKMEINLLGAWDEEEDFAYYC